MTVVKIKPQFPQPQMTEQLTGADNSSHIPFLNKSTLYQKTRKFHAPHFHSVLQADALIKNFHLYFDEKKHKKFSFLSQFTFTTFLASNLFLLDAFSITKTLQSYSSFFMILSFFSLITLCILLPSLISTEQLKIDNNKVPLIWILYHNLQFKSEAQKESWLLHHISNNNYYHHSFFFSAHSFSADIQKHIADAQKQLDNLAT